MLKVLVLLVVVSFLMVGCAGVDVYTFKKDRVDQKIKGNEGYIMGQKPPGPREARDPKRTLIGVDVDVSAILGEEEAEEAEEIKKAPPPPQEAKKIAAKEVETKKLPPAKAETEEEYIK